MLLWYASHSQAIRQEIKQSIQQKFKEEFDCLWDGDIVYIDLLSLRIHVKNISMLPAIKNEGWSFYADTFEISASLLDFILYRRFECHGSFQHALMYESFQNTQSDFLPVISKMFSSSLPSSVSFKYITIQQGHILLHQTEFNNQSSLSYHAQMSRESDGLHAKIYIIDGFMFYKNRLIFDTFFGNIISIIPYNQDKEELYVRVDCRLSIPALGEKGACFFVGNIYRARGAFVVSNEDQSFIIEPLKFKIKDHSMPFSCGISMNFDTIQHLITQQIFDEQVQGNSTLNLTGNLYDIYNSLQANIDISHVWYKQNQLIDHAYINFNKEEAGYKAVLSMDGKDIAHGLMIGKDNLFKFSLINVMPLQPWFHQYWNIPCQQAKIEGVINTLDYTIASDYKIQLKSVKLDATTDITGSCTVDEKALHATGSFLDQTYSCMIKFFPTLHIFQLKSMSHDEVLFDIHEHDNPEEGTIGFLGFSVLKNMVPDYYKASFSQPGKFAVQGKMRQGLYHAHLATDDAHIRIPSLYNVIHDFSAALTVDIMGKSLMIDSMVAHLYEGTIRCNHAAMHYDKHAQVSFLHIPLFLDNVLMCWNKGIFGIVSGRLFLSQLPNKIPSLQGNLMVDQAQLKGNIFSHEFQEQFVQAVGSSQGVDLDSFVDITIETKDPIVVETSFLQAMINLDLHVGKTLKKPEIEGTIDIVSGELKFPYKSLYITHGQILIMPKNSTDPVIEFVAKGKIKRYDITMRATGTMIDQQIHFESSPYLTEEQIISLLLVGSQDSSLSVVMPAVFMQKLHEIVFGPALSQSKLDIMFNRLLQSFKNIRIFPQFTNQTGRGGVRGVIEVDATDRLHGRIDSNLMQLEDTIFEADYLLTDDVTIRAIKDGPSTYGGEVEMRWKFS